MSDTSLQTVFKISSYMTLRYASTDMKRSYETYLLTCALDTFMISDNYTRCKLFLVETLGL